MRQETDRLREPAAWALIGFLALQLIVDALRVFFGVGSGVDGFRARAYGGQSALLDVLTPVLLAVAVLLTTHAGSRTPRARTVTRAALGVLAAQGVAGLVVALGGLAYEGGSGFADIPAAARVEQTAINAGVLVLFALCAYFMIVVLGAPVPPTVTRGKSLPHQEWPSYAQGVAYQAAQAGSVQPSQPSQPQSGRQETRTPRSAATGAIPAQDGAARSPGPERGTSAGLRANAGPPAVSRRRRADAAAPEAGQTASGQTSGHRSSADQGSAGRASGAGQSAGDPTSAGHTAVGQTAAGQPAAGQTASGHAAVGRTGADRSAVGHAAAGRTAGHTAPQAVVPPRPAGPPPSPHSRPGP
jgi:hypothetical protein